MTYLESLQTALVEASRERARAHRRRVRRRGAVCAAVVVLLTPPALAATGVWRPELGDGHTPPPTIATDTPPPDQLALLGVLRREQTGADRGVASRYALKFVGSPTIEGVRTDSIRLLAQSERDRGIVLVPVRRYTPHVPKLPADLPEAARKVIERPPIDDALCIYQLDIDGAGVACYSSADVREGKAWMQLGRRALWIVPDGVASVRTEYTDHAPLDAPAHDNAVVMTVPEGRVTERRSTFLDAGGKPVRVIDRPADGPVPPPPPPALGATHSGVVQRVGVDKPGLDARYELRVRAAKGAPLYIALERPACAGKRRVSIFFSVSGRDPQIPVTPSFGDFDNARWCPGTYRGSVRLKGERKPRGTFTFRVLR